MKVKLLKMVRRDARSCWNSIHSITTIGRRIVSLSCPQFNSDVLEYFCGGSKPLDSDSEEEKIKFIVGVVHRYWKVRKGVYYKKYRKAVKK